MTEKLIAFFNIFANLAGRSIIFAGPSLRAVRNHTKSASVNTDLTV